MSDAKEVRKARKCRLGKRLELCTRKHCALSFALQTNQNTLRPALTSPKKSILWVGFFLVHLFAGCKMLKDSQFTHKYCCTSRPPPGYTRTLWRRSFCDKIKLSRNRKILSESVILIKQQFDQQMTCTTTAHHDGRAVFATSLLSQNTYKYWTVTNPTQTILYLHCPPKLQVLPPSW